MLSTKDVEFHVEVEASKEAYKRMEEHELLYTQGIANFVKSLTKSCNKCKHCEVYIDKVMYLKAYVCSNPQSKYCSDLVPQDWTCNSFERKGE